MWMYSVHVTCTTFMKTINELNEFSGIKYSEFSLRTYDHQSSNRKTNLLYIDQDRQIQ